MKRILSILPFLLLSFLTIQAQDAKEIIQKAEDKLRGGTSKAEMTMQIIRPTWTREMSMKSWTKGDQFAMILITSPAKDKGNAFLKRGKEVWNWVPSVERNIKLPPSMMAQSWMGTDFTNDDLVRESSLVKDFTHKLVGSETVDGRESWKIELTAKPEAAVVWGKIILWIDKKDYIQMKAEFYDEEEELVNTMLGKDIKPLGGRILPSKIEMIPADKKGEKTVIIYKDMEFETPIQETFFSTQNMKNLR